MVSKAICVNLFCSIVRYIVQFLAEFILIIFVNKNLYLIYKNSIDSYKIKCKIKNFNVTPSSETKLHYCNIVICINSIL